jgi:hypothetical protein
MNGSEKGFWEFFKLRQLAFWRKNLLKFPVSKDPVVARFHFCNVYREADKGTRWFHEFKDPTRALDNSLVYRPINRIDTFAAWGGIPDLEEGGAFVKWLEHRVKTDKVFTGRHLNIGMKKYETMIRFLQGEDQIWSQLMECSTRKAATDVLQTIPSVGPFFSWQVLCDLLETPGFLPKSVEYDNWALLGPGAKTGARLVFPDKDPDFTAAWLYQFQPRDLPEPPPEAPGPVSIKNIEHALCEYARYVRATNWLRDGGRRPGKLEDKPWAKQ